MYIEICDDITMKYKITMILVNNNLGRKILPERKNALICDESKNFYSQLYRAYLNQTCYDISYKVNEDEFTENKDHYC